MHPLWCHRCRMCCYQMVICQKLVNLSLPIKNTYIENPENFLAKVLILMIFLCSMVGKLK